MNDADTSGAVLRLVFHRESKLRLQCPARVPEVSPHAGECVRQRHDASSAVVVTLGCGLFPRRAVMLRVNSRSVAMV